MERVEPKKDLSGKVKTALHNAVVKNIPKEQVKNGHFIVSDEVGNKNKISARDI